MVPDIDIARVSIPRRTSPSVAAGRERGAAVSFMAPTLGTGPVPAHLSDDLVRAPSSRPENPVVLQMCRYGPRP
ncbi:hypothetical protein GCM10010357_03980 [Streptomyces luteireticuli]|uniref:Uncharacterized protein n=1 Tax=Streptomyces luteireticuli TaxID=173858 RepID=A0ABN0Y7Y3_9ACTN